MRPTLSILSLALVGLASAAAVNVSYTVSGTSGNYVLDFTVNNNIQDGQQIYFFGVKLSDRNIVASPGDFNPDAWSSWSYNYYGGGSDTEHNNNWIGGPAIQYGESLSGFKVQIADEVAPTNVQWFAYAYGNEYCGNEGLQPRIQPRLRRRHQ